MKKLIALLLILACAFSLAACKKDDGDDNNQTNTNNVSNDVFTKVTSMLSTSRPTKIVGSTVIVSGDTTLDGYYTLIMGKIDGNSVGVTLNPASGIISDGWVSVGSSVEETDDAGWNHQGAGNWVTKGGTGKKVEHDEWPDQVGIYGDNWNAFKLW